MTAHLADQICIWAAVIIPIPLIIAFRWVGVVLGTLAVWAILVVAGAWISSLDAKRDAAMLDAVWLFFGWIGGLLYCLPIFGLRELVAYIMRRRRHPSTVSG